MSSLVRSSRISLPANGGPVVLAILDGVGYGAGDAGDAVARAYTPTLDRLTRPGRAARLLAHGKAVGLPSNDDMGNSEVGHNALGAGKIHDQGAKLVGNALASEALFASDAWTQAMQRSIAGGALHFVGLLSDGNVHSHQDHLHAMLRKAAQTGCNRLYVHALLDGRDVPPTSALIYVDRLEQLLASLRASRPGLDARIATGGGRMTITMDRYEADWAMVERGWNLHVHGHGPRFPTMAAAIEAYRDLGNQSDQDLPGFVISGDGRADPSAPPVATMRDGDSVILFNFRGDRAIEFSRAFDDPNFAVFDRGKVPAVFFCGMMEYDGDLHIPKHYLVSPPQIARPMGELLAEAGVTQLAISETQKYGHVTYFWNGNRSGKFDDKLETYVEIPSDLVPFDQRPWMKAAEITDRLISELRTGRHQFARVNYANGDMVGHTGALDATILAVQTVDLQLARLASAVELLGGTLAVTADHGNADEMLQRDKAGKPLVDPKSGQPLAKTSHTLNPVPFIIHHRDGSLPFYLPETTGTIGGISNVTATCLELLGFVVPDDLEPSLLVWR